MIEPARDYGFFTLSPGTDRIAGIVNSKYPVFGPRYDKIKQCFKTYHVVDTTQFGFHDFGLPEPTVSGEMNTNRAARRLEQKVLSFKHGFSKRPLGYINIAGTLQMNIREKCDYERREDYGDQFAPSASYSGTNTFAVDVEMGIENVAETQGSGFSGHFLASDYYWDWALSSFGQTAPIILPSNYPFNLYSIAMSRSVANAQDFSSTDSLNYALYPPFRVKITDTEVELYRCVYQCQWYDREYDYANYQLLQNLKSTVDWAGSVFNVTAYLCPFSVGDFYNA